MLDTLDLSRVPSFGDKESAKSAAQSLGLRTWRYVRLYADRIPLMPGPHENSFPNFTPEARRLWAKLPEEIREKLLANVYCGSGCRMTTIVDYHGFCERGTVVLQGRCKRCNGEVARVID